MNKSILFLVGDAYICGGTYVILQHAEHLHKLGYEVTIALVYMPQDKFLVFRDSDQCWHPALRNLRFINISEAMQAEYDSVIFTWWATVVYATRLKAKSYVYFVQSIESRFYMKEDTFMREIADRSYQIGLPVITEATWIHQLLLTRYKNNVQLVKNGILKSLYTPEGERIADKPTHQLRVLVEGPIHAPYKNVKKTVELCLKANVGEIWLLTSTPIKDFPGVSRIFSQVPITEVPKIYRSCDVIVKLSYVEGMFGPPLEMFHCGGTAIVYDVTGYDEYITHNVNALVAKTDDEDAVINYLTNLNADRSLLTRLTQGALATAAQWITWEESSNQFRNALEVLTAAPFTPELKSFITNKSKQYFYESIEVVIVKNGTQERSQFTAEPILSATGYYMLTVPLSQGETQIAVLFGKHYQRLVIMLADLQGVNNSAPLGKMQTSFHHMVQDEGQIYITHSTAAMLVVSTSLKDKNLSNNPTFSLRVVFRPVIRQTEKITIAEMT